VRRLLLVLLLSVTVIAASADELIMMRSARPFAEAMDRLGQAITEHGYRIQRVQRVDVGLSSGGFPSAEYRIVFFGKPDEFNALAAAHPRLLPYLPLRITIFAEGNSTVLATSNPALLGPLFRDEALRTVFQHWETDVQSILEQAVR
jgi:uncharacterized protein (DUF302 family)